MKKSIILFVAALALSACSTDLSDIERRIADVEKQGKELEEANKKLKEDSENLKRQGEELESAARKRQEENEKIQKRLQELEDEVNTVEPKLLSMEFLAADNPYQLIENTPCTIVGDTAVECRILNVANDKVLIPRFTFEGSVVTINGKEAESGVTPFDFSGTVVLSVITTQKIKDYTVFVTSYTGLPTVWLETSNHVNVATANRYYDGSIKVVKDSKTRAANNTTEAKVKIMGLGTINWYYPDYSISSSEDRLLAKNTYALQFTTGISLFDDPKGTVWELFPNNGDLTFLHNQTAFYLGKISRLDYTPRAHFVEMFLNSRFYGTYLMEERLEVSANKVDVGSDGFILSVGSTEQGSTFNTSHLTYPVTVVAPAKPSSEALSYIKNYVTTAENALYASDFANASSGWQKYMDIDALVDWYLINEIAKNSEGAFKSDCVMHLKRGGKLKMGPLWNFEKAFDNNSKASATGFVVKNAVWFARLFQDPAFVAKVKERFSYFYGHQQDIISEINVHAEYLKYAVKEDDNRWGTFAGYTSSSKDAWGVYGSKVSDMKTWLVTRMDWLKKEFDVL
ncbi:MAG: CotH kinase family protein [Prevotella sp.]|nr:CotH kinase family protein [Prevotella sp.]